MITIYLAGPIDDITVDEAGGWRRQIAKAWPDVLFFDPLRAWHNAHTSTARAVSYGNRSAIMNCSGLLANLTGPGRAFGTIREVEFAAGAAKYVAVAGDVVSLMACDVIVRKTVEEAMEELMQALADAINSPPMSLWSLLSRGIEGEG